MAGFQLDFIDPVNIEFRILTQLGGVFLRNDSQLGPGFTSTNFYFKPGVEFIFLGPDGPHLRSAVTFDHSF
ncbi:hypothetical protein D3C76_1728700 [compost metagenome]